MIGFVPAYGGRRRVGSVGARGPPPDRLRHDGERGAVARRFDGVRRGSRGTHPAAERAPGAPELPSRWTGARRRTRGGRPSGRLRENRRPEDILDKSRVLRGRTMREGTGRRAIEGDRRTPWRRSAGPPDLQTPRPRTGPGRTGRILPPGAGAPPAGACGRDCGAHRDTSGPERRDPIGGQLHEHRSPSAHGSSRAPHRHAASERHDARQVGPPHPWGA